VDVIG